MDKPFPIVGVGASAGGVEALEYLFKAMPPEPGMAFVIITHLAPHRESMLPEILARDTRMPVLIGEHDHPIRPNHVYAAPESTMPMAYSPWSSASAAKNESIGVRSWPSAMARTSRRPLLMPSTLSAGAA